jgi:signal transduction histidine kinase
MRNVQVVLVGFAKVTRDLTLFDPFRRQARRPSRNNDGLGLGLFICRELVAAHGGEISVHSSDEAGTVFTVRLPRRR